MNENKLRMLLIHDRVLVINDLKHTMFSLSKSELKTIKKNDLMDISDKLCNEIYNNITEINNVKDISIKVLYIMMSNKCNLKCNFCSYGCNDELNKSEQIDFESDYKRFIKFIEDINPKKIIFTGGEPLMNSRIYNYIQLSKLYTNAIIVLQTNGYFLNKIDCKLFDLIDCVEISTSHYEIEKLSSTFNILMKNNVKTYATFVFNNNYNKLIDIIDLCIDLEIELKINFVSGFGSALFNEIELCDGETKLSILYLIAKHLLTKKGNIRVLENNFRNPMNFYIPCSAYGRGLTIFPDGSLYPCHSLKDSRYCLGNINEYSAELVKEKYFKLLSEDWYKKKFKIFKNIRCEKCKYIEICGGYCIAKRNEENFLDCSMRKFWVDLNVNFDIMSNDFYKLLEMFIIFYNQNYNCY